MGLTAEEKAKLRGQAQVAPKAPAVDTDAALLTANTSTSLEETEPAKLARLAREQKARNAAALSGQDTPTDVIALGQDAKAKAALSEKLRKDFKVVDATWETDLDMDKWYGAKIASLDAALEANKAGNIFYTKINDYGSATATEANIMDLTGQLARNRNQFDQIKAGTHAWAKTPEGSWTFGEAKADLRESIDATAPPAAPARQKMTLEGRKPLGYEKSEWAYSDDELLAFAEKGEFPPGLELTATEREVGGGMLPKRAPIEPGYQALPDNKYDRFLSLRERRDQIRMDIGNEIKRKEATPRAIAVLTGTVAASAFWVWGPVIAGMSVAQLKGYAVSLGVDLALMYGAAKIGQFLQEDELEELRQEVDKLKNAEGNYEWDKTDSGDTGPTE